MTQTNGAAAHDEPVVPIAEVEVVPVNDVTIRPVQSWLVPEVWPLVEDLIDRAIATGPGDCLASDYLELLCHAKAQLWLVMVDRKLTAAVVTQIMVRPRRKVCSVELMAGEDIERWMPEFDRVITKWAREIGCAAGESPVRPGLAQFMRKFGFKEIHRIIRRRIDD